jgi:ribosomal protein L21E
MKFNVGDKVRVVSISDSNSEEDRDYIGRIGTVVRADCYKWPYAVRGLMPVENYDTFWYDYELELVSE